MTPATLAEKTRSMQRQVILDAAASLFAENGPASVSMRKIAEQSKTSTSVVYNLFGNKRGIVKALFMEAYTTFQSRLTALDFDDVDLNLLLQVSATLWDFSEEHPNFFRITHGMAFHDFRPCDVKRQMPQPTPQQLLRSAIRALQARKMFCGASADDVMVSIYATAIGLINVRINGLFQSANLDKKMFLRIMDRTIRGTAGLTDQPPNPFTHHHSDTGELQ